MAEAGAVVSTSSSHPNIFALMRHAPKHRAAPTTAFLDLFLIVRTFICASIHCHILFHSSLPQSVRYTLSSAFLVNIYTTMAQQLHGLPPNIDTVPDEVLDRIVELLIAHDRPGAENLALTNRRLQAKIYRSLYPVLTIQSTNLDRLARLGRPKYQYSKEIVFEYELPRYDCNECNTRMPHSEVENHSKKFRSVLKDFFAAIIFYDPRSWAQARLTLDLFCPSDHQHWGFRHRSRFASSEACARVENLRMELDIFVATHDLGHRFAQLGPSPDVNGLLRPFTMTAQPHPSVLLSLESQVLKDPTLFQELYITRQMCRQIDPKTMIFLLKCMPMLKKFHYEKWKTPGDEPDLCLESKKYQITSF